MNASDSLSGKLLEYSLPSGEITMSPSAAKLSGGETSAGMYRVYFGRAPAGRTAKS